LPLLGVDGKKKGPINFRLFLERYKIPDIIAPSALTTSVPETVTSESTTEDTSSVTARTKGLETFVQEVSHMLFKNRAQVEALFRFFDANGDGMISPVEFKNGLLSLAIVLNNSTLHDEHIEQMVKVIDKNGDGQISYDEFFGQFDLSSTSVLSTSTSSSTSSTSSSTSTSSSSSTPST